MPSVQASNMVHYLGKTVNRAELSYGDVLFYQRLLTAEDFYTGKLDGQWGPITNKASLQFLEESQALIETLGKCDARTEKNIRSLRLITQREARLFMQRIKEAGLQEKFTVKIICGTRTYPEQNRLYGQGRTTPGNIVTHRKAGSSRHNFGLAWDIGIFSNTDGSYYTGGTTKQRNAYATVAEIALDQEVINWGGLWRRFKDLPHYQLHSELTVAQIRSRFLKGEEYLNTATAIV